MDISSVRVTDIKKMIQNLTIDQYPHWIEKLLNDPRTGVQTLSAALKRKQQLHEKELQRLYEMSQFEQALYNTGVELIAGVDEVGRGPLAGPVVAAAVILPKGCLINGINDSKKLSESKREKLYHIISEKALSIGVGIVDSETIDQINILNATYKAMQLALRELMHTPEAILVDAVTIPDITIPQKPIIKGDAKSISIAAASIIAKVTRDRMMKDFHQRHPQYGFDQNKGYGTAVHIEAIKNHGLLPIHRRSFTKNI